MAPRKKPMVTAGSIEKVETQSGPSDVGTDFRLDRKSGLFLPEGARRGRVRIGFQPDDKGA